VAYNNNNNNNNNNNIVIAYSSRKEKSTFNLLVLVLVAYIRLDAIFSLKLEISRCLD